MEFVVGDNMFLNKMISIAQPITTASMAWFAIAFLIVPSSAFPIQIEQVGQVELKNQVDQVSTLANSLESKTDSTDRDRKDNELQLPEWVKHPPVETGRLFLLVTTDGHLDPASAEQDIQTKMEQRLSEQVDRWIRPGAGKLLAYDSQYINANLRMKDKTEFVAQDFEYGAKFGEEFKYTYAGFTLLELDDEFRSEVMDRWEKHETHSRLLQTCLIGGLVLIGLTALFGFFRVDNATRGFYTRRLLMATVLVLLVAAAIAHWCGCRFPWL